MSDVIAHLPGRLGQPDLALVDDPRCDKRIVDVLKAFGNFGGDLEPPSADASYQEVLDYCATFERNMATQGEAIAASMPAFDSVEQHQLTIVGPDQNDVPLFISKPKGEGSWPGIVHLHGGGMVIGQAADPMYVLWRSVLASMGMVVIGVEFRNAAGVLGDHPFPAGLNDCATAVRWVHDNRAELGISQLVLNGESGGGNLVLATALKANKEGWINQIDGAFAMCPYISGCYADPLPALLSLQENDDYTLNCDIMRAMVKAYDPQAAFSHNPLAWPYHASVDELKGLPPHVISVNELDPLRDEGLAYYRKLSSAGVPVIGRTVLGTPHAGDIAFPGVIDDIYQDSARAVFGFASSLTGDNGQ